MEQKIKELINIFKKEKEYYANMKYAIDDWDSGNISGHESAYSHIIEKLEELVKSE